VPQRQDLQFITLGDFRPGIFSDWFANSLDETGAPDGAAQVTGTYGCVASRTGALIAAPKKVRSVTQAMIDADNGTGHKYPTSDHKMHVLGMRVASPAYSSLLAGGTQSAYPDMPVLALGWWYDSTDVGTAFKQRGVVRAYKQFLATPSTYDIANATTSGTTTLGAKYSFDPATVEIGRANNSAPTQMGRMTVFGSVLPAGGSAATAVAFPSNAAPDTDAVSNLMFKTASIAIIQLFAHQDRLFCMSYGSPLDTSYKILSFGASAGNDGTESLYYTNTRTYDGGTTANFIQFVNENPYGYGSWRSLNAGELLLVKKRGGGVMVRGDVDRPQILRLPGIESTGMAVNIGCPLPDGTFLYGSERGAWIWSGGDTTQLASPQLEGWFWRNSSTDVSRLCDPTYFRGSGDGFALLMGTWAMCGDRLVFGPNNFVYDFMGKGWWRHSDPSSTIYGFHDNSASNKLWAAPYSIDATQTEALALFDPSYGQGEFYWRSQPLSRSRGRRIDARTLDVVVQGHGTVVFQLLQGLSAASGPSHTISVNSDQPVSVNIPTSLTGHDLVLSIHSTSSDANTYAAPSVLRVQVGYYEAVTARQ
jgi:hypothetical protein